MLDVAIRCERLSKLYRIGERERYKTLSGVLTDVLKAPLRRIRQAFRSPKERPPKRENNTIWALRDVSFEVERGEVIGIIGRNGAGKTTLLKVLSRITEPTEGRAEIHGRVGSLLEVGTGFHPELTGRENIYLNGAILGMRRPEIESRFDEIVEFAEIERFLDTPLKRYSSGMYVRLAFAVAAHLEPHILIVDEVLAVGDHKFQRKCLGKLGRVASEGRTVLLVSHQMNQIRRLCPRTLWLDEGRLRLSGTTAQVVAAYEAAMRDIEDGGHASFFFGWEIENQGHVIEDGVRPCTFKLRVLARERISRGHFGIAIQSEGGLLVAGWSFDDLAVEPGHKELRVRLPMLPLRPGAYQPVFSMFNEGNNLTGGRVVEIWHAVPLLVVSSEPVAHAQDQWAGVLNVAAELSVVDLDDVERRAGEALPR